LFKRQQVGECHDTPPIGPNALLRNQAIRSPVWRCFKIVRVLQERHCSPKKTRQKTLRHDIDAWADHHGIQVSPADGGCGLCSIVRRNRVSFSARAVTGPWTHGHPVRMRNVRQARITMIVAGMPQGPTFMGEEQGSRGRSPCRYR
jgi:hypothetical protein